MARAQSIVCRGDQILMVKHRAGGVEWWCLPGGGILEGEPPAEAALRELREECRVDGRTLRETATAVYGPGDNHHTFLVDIGQQQPQLGHDPEIGDGDPVLIDLRWLSLSEIPERDRAYLWAAGLLGVGGFAGVVESWGDDPSYPTPTEHPPAAAARAGNLPTGAERPLAEQMQLLCAIVQENPVLQAALDTAAACLPPAWYLGAGCIAQAVWNHLSQTEPMTGINDLDLVYFDAGDLSEAGEEALARRLRQELGGLGVRIDVKNQARVHLWYEGHFGYPIRPYCSLEDAVTSWPTTATCVGVRRSSQGMIVSAPYGLNDLFGMVVRPNKRQITREIYERKARRWIQNWPDLQIIPW